MNKPSWLFWIVSVVGVIWGGFGVIDYQMTSSGDEEYLKDFPPEMIAWIQDFPAWRQGLWAFSVLAALFGPILLLLRRRFAAPVLIAGATTMIVGFVGHDLLMANGLKYYGAAGTAVSVVIALVSVFFAWYALRQSARGVLR